MIASKPAPECAPSRYVELGLCLVLLRPNSKRPIPHPESGSWWLLQDEAALIAALQTHPQANIAIRCDGIVQVDSDSDSALDWAITRGLSSKSAWVLRTARGWRVFYRAPDPCPISHTDSTHQIPDLLAPGGLGVVPPSIHPSGFRYFWELGHSPFDILPHDLAPLPDAILKAWQEFKAVPASPPRSGNTPGWLGLVFDAICDHLSMTGRRLRHTREGSLITTCPLHDDRHPSFSIHPHRGWRCFAGCGEGRLTQLAARLGIQVTQEAVR